MQAMRSHPRHLLVLFVALLWTCSFADNQESTSALAVADDAGETVSMSAAKDEEGEEEGGEEVPGLKKKMNMGQGGYQVIPNFVYSHKAKKANVENREGCENVCDEQSDCHSFSYNAGMRTCMWSTKHLKFDSRFSFHMKETKMDDMGKMKSTGKYKKFDNFGFHEPGWRKLISDEAGCRDLCEKINRCGAYSYRNYDQQCMLSGNGVKFDTDWVYYDRNMPPPPDMEEMKLMKGQEEDHDLADAPAQEIKESSTAKAAKILHAKAKVALKKILEEKARLSEMGKEEDDTEEREQKMRDGMTAAQRERKFKLDTIAKIEKLKAATGDVLGVKAKMNRPDEEAKRKATTRIQTAFKEGYKKAQHINHKAYEKDVEEISVKGADAAKEHSGKTERMAKKMEEEQQKAEKKEQVEKEQAEKEYAKEVKQKATQKARVESIKEFAADNIRHQTLRAKNEKKLKMILTIGEKRRKREKSRKERKLKAIAHEKQKKIDKIKADARERKEKISHEANMKEEERKHVEFSSKRKEQAHKEIDKKEQVHKRRKKAEELKLKLEQAKKDAQELNDKHKERETKVGACQERRAKGQFVTYAYARSAAFTNAMSPEEKFGSQAEYNGMLRVQNGLGNKKQNAYMKFSAQGNKIVDEERAMELVQLSESGEDSNQDPNVYNAASKLIIDQAKATYVARRRWVDRRRRWSVEPVVSDRRRDVLASRRRELSERRRRSIGKLETEVRKAVLKVFKFGGPAAKLTVKATACGWERASIDYTNAQKLSTPESMLRAQLALLSTEEGQGAQLGAEDTEQAGYWNNHASQANHDNDKLLGDADSRGPPPDIPIPKPYVADRRRYIDRRRRFPTPEDPSGENEPSAPNPTDRRRRFVGQTTGTVYAPEGNNIWLTVDLSANLVGVMRSVDKLCFEISGGGPTEPVILGSEKSTNKPYIQLNIMGEAGARRRRCSQVVALDNLSKPNSENVPGK